MGDRAEERSGGVALWGMGFRPLFLLGSLHAVVMVLYWVGGLQNFWKFSGQLNIVYVHVHEMVFGFGAAIVGGFLLTASANWTQTRGTHGLALQALVGLWLLGRLGLVLALLGFHPLWLWLDVLFIPGVMLAVAPSLWRARKWHNLVMLGWLAVFEAGHILYLLEVSWLWMGWGRRGLYLGLNVILVFLMLIGGRILPFFTRSALQDPSIQKWPQVDRLALVSLVLYVVTALIWGELHVVTGGVAFGVGVLMLLRMRYWGTLRTFRNPLLWILHLAYLWVVVGFVLHGCATQGWVPWSAAVHAFTVGGMGGFVLGMISRVSLGHTGRPLRASGWATAAYVVLSLTAVARLLATWAPAAWYHVLIMTAGLGWSLAFLLFLWEYAPILLRPRADGKSG